MRNSSKTVFGGPSMKRSKKSLWNMISVLILLVVVIGMFYWYSEENNKRIEVQNRTYAGDSALQTSNRVNDEFRNALSRISTYAYFTGESLSEPVVTSRMLAGMTIGGI